MILVRKLVALCASEETGTENKAGESWRVWQH
jgi:hypothetical protein